MLDDKVIFYCQECGKVAATVKTTADMLVVGFLGETSWKIKEAWRAVLVQIRQDGDPSEILKALASIDAELVSFHCPDCDLSYCGQHWSPEIRFDDDWLDWYDCTYGTCPQGHCHLLDD